MLCITPIFSNAKWSHDDQSQNLRLTGLPLPHLISHLSVANDLSYGTNSTLNHLLNTFPSSDSPMISFRGPIEIRLTRNTMLIRINLLLEYTIDIYTRNTSEDHDASFGREAAGDML